MTDLRANDAMAEILGDASCCQSWNDLKEQDEPGEGKGTGFSLERPLLKEPHLPGDSYWV